MNTLPVLSAATARGPVSDALAACAPSPENPVRELPAKRVMKPLASILNTELLRAGPLV